MFTAERYEQVMRGANDTGGPGDVPQPNPGGAAVLAAVGALVIFAPWGRWLGPDNVRAVRPKPERARRRRRTAKPRTPGVTEKRTVIDPHGERLRVGKLRGEWHYFYDGEWTPIRYYGGGGRRVEGNRLV